MCTWSAFLQPLSCRTMRAGKAITSSLFGHDMYSFYFFFLSLSLSLSLFSRLFTKNNRMTLCFESNMACIDHQQTVHHLNVSSELSVCESSAYASPIDAMRQPCDVTDTDAPLFSDLLETYGIIDQYVSAQPKEWKQNQLSCSHSLHPLGEKMNENICECMFSDILCHTGSAENLFDMSTNESTERSCDSPIYANDVHATNLAHSDAQYYWHDCYDDHVPEPDTSYGSFVAPHAQYISLLRILDVMSK